MRVLPILAAALAAALLIAPLGAQSQQLCDDGSPSITIQHKGGPGAQPPGSLTTIFTSDNQYAGNMFDITPAFDMEFTGMDINVSEIGGTATIEVWWIVGTSVGNENSSAGWNLMGTYTSAAGGTAGTDQPTFIDLSGNGVCFSANQTYGIYVNLTSYLGGVQALRYTNGGPNTYSNADLSLVTNCGKGVPGFTGSTFYPRQWNGTLYYDDCGGGGGPTLAMNGTCPGPVTFTVTGSTPGATIAWVWGFPGTFTWMGTPCTGLTLDLMSPTLAATSASTSLTANVPASACGRVRVQAVDLTACAATNYLDL